jgi:TfoX/Sxy family transcriptional regulator of competence genes
MATSQEYVEFVCDQIRGAGFVRYRKMFGEYMVYVNEKPLLLVCDNQVYVKPLDALKGVLRDAAMGAPYQGAKEHYVLDIDDREKSREVVALLERVTPLPPPKKPKAKKD